MFFARPILLVSCLGLTAALIGCSGSSVLSKAGTFYDKDGPPDSSHSFSAQEHTALKVEKPYKAANRPYTVIIIMNDKTVINSPPIRVTAHNGILSKNPQLSMVVTISAGKVV